jgi:ATP-binding cassette, subfamily B, bacterial PglK
MKILLLNLNKILSELDRRNFYFLLALSLIFAMIEVAGVASIMPLVNLAMDLDLLDSNLNYSYWFELSGIESKVDFLIVFGILVLVYFLFRALFTILYTKILSGYIFGTYYQITVRLFEKYLDLSYSDFARLNSSNMTKMLITEAYNLAGVLQLLLVITSEIIILCLIYAILLYVDIKITLYLTLILVFVSLILAATVSKKIKNIGSKRVFLHKKMYESINKSLNNYKIVKLTPVDNFIDDFRDSCTNFKGVLISNGVLQSIPRVLLEFVSFSILILLVLYIFYNSYPDTSSAMGVVSIFILGLYRMMPSINKIISGYNQLLFNLKSIDVITSELYLDSENLGSDKVSFSEKIILDNASFSYGEDEILKGVNIVINKGDKIAFIGESGCGKSTLVDIIMGLQKVNKGKFIIDSSLVSSSNVKDWRAKIGYIPQSIYLFDGTVADNIVFGREYDENKIKSALKKSKIYDYLMINNGINTMVGENGMLLSGGQKQRIAIARALYDDPEVLVLDEATSALDFDTEEKIMDEIYRIDKNLTIIIIAHRINTLDRCDTIYKIENNALQVYHE